LKQHRERSGFAADEDDPARSIRHVRRKVIVAENGLDVQTGGCKKVLQHGQADVPDALDKAERLAAVFKGNRLENEAIPVFALDFKADAADDMYAEGRQGVPSSNS
jgi:hypothetical protein